MKQWQILQRKMKFIAKLLNFIRMNIQILLIS